MTRDRRNNLFITLTILVVLIVSGSTYVIISLNEPKKIDKGFLVAFAADHGQNPWFNIDTFKVLRNYTTYSLTTDSFYNMQTLEKARKHINSIKEKRDTLNGVHVVLNDKTPYYFFIKTVEYFYEKDPHAFAPHDNDIYAWYVYVPPKEKRPENKMDK